MDDEADNLNIQVLKDLMDHMVNDTPAIQRAVQTIITARCLERVADHATNIAERCSSSPGGEDHQAPSDR